jgi:hypothetical protein
MELPNEAIFDPNPNKIKPLVPFRNEPIVELAGRAVEATAQQVVAVLGTRDFDIPVTGE